MTLLACFRQAYQRLRERIRDGRRLEWWATGRGPGYLEYQTFKALTEFFASLLAREAVRGWFRISPAPPSSDEAIRRILGATSVVVDWEPEARRLLSLDDIAAGLA